MDNTLYISNNDFDIRTLRKVAALNSNLGRISIHDATDGYLLSFSDCPMDDPQQAIQEYQKRLHDFANNIWSH